MSQSSEVFSIRIVIADFYLEKPILGLDPCNSEFRGKEIKKVPIVRIFGSNSNGQKTCMHVHGVFPYFYIPYESKDFDSLNKAIYQIAFNIDKAINISLGQTQSTTQHVFKIQLVKGIPFYGYHRREHQYLKIYMYNPRFVRRAANLLQNGSILGKVFHPHESHVPYVLQFMIDYNLYGMSFLHVPLEIVKFRRNNEEDIVKFAGTFKKSQILNTMTAKKQSCSALEVDIGSNFILNRFQLVAKNNTSKHSNPGIEAIWHDEDVRRRKLIASLGDDEEKINDIPALEIPSTQERPNLQPTDSDAFYRAGLLTKLSALENTITESASMLDQTFNSSTPPSQANITLNIANLSNKEMRRTFNLKKLLANSVYPEECTPDEQLVDASCIENHLSGGSFFQNNFTDSTPSLYNAEQGTAAFDESAFLDDTIVDEEMFLNLTQEPHVPLNATLRNEDMELLDVLQQLEEHNEFENPVDLDSSLAPILQQHNDFELTPQLLDKETVAIACSQISPDNEIDSENEGDCNLQDFSIALDDIDDLILKLSQSQSTVVSEKTSKDDMKLPQIDGADDTMPKTPEKIQKSHSHFKQQSTPPRSPKTPKNIVRSPRTPKSSAASKYAPLPLVITKHSAIKNIEHTFSSARSERDIVNAKDSSAIPLRKKLALSKMRRKTISSAKELWGPLEAAEESEGKTHTPRARKNSVDLEKTHITCSFTPRRRSERLLKFCDVESMPQNVERLPRKSKVDALKALKQKTDKKKQSETALQQHKSQSKIVKNKNPHGLKKILVRIPRKNLFKLAEDFKRSKQKPRIDLSPTNREHERSKNIETETAELIEEKTIEKKAKTGNINVNDSQKTIKVVERDKNQNSTKKNIESKLPGQAADNHIRRNLSQLLKVFQTADEISDIQNNSEILEPNVDLSAVKQQKSLNEKLTNTETELKIVKRSSLSLNRYRIKKDKNSTSASKDNGKVTNCTSDDNIRKNLSDLMKALQGTDQSEQKSKEFNENDNIGNQLEETADTSISSLRLSESFSKNDDDFEEEIAASETEDDAYTRKMKRTPTFQRLRRAFRARGANGTPTTTPANRISPETPSERLLDLSISVNSPSVFSEYSSPVVTPKDIKKTVQLPNKSSINTSDRADLVILAPLLLPPTREETLKTCEKLQIYEYEFQKPFYSNPDDVTKGKEVGFTVLQIPGNKLIDCAEFQSVLATNIGGLADWRRKKLLEIDGGQMLQLYRNQDRMREFFATKKEIVIQPQLHPPSRHDAKVWLKAKEMLQGKDAIKEKGALLIDQDSPIKIKRQKIMMMFNDETATGNDDADDMDITSCSLSLTPLTPATPLRHSNEENTNKTTDSTPLTTAIKETNEAGSSSKKPRRRYMRTKSVRKSLNEKLKAAADVELAVEGKLKGNKLETLERVNDSLPSSQHSNCSSNDSSSISSQVVLAELERLSFVKQLQKNKNKNELNVSFGLSSASLNNTFGFKVNFENLQDAKADVECNNLTSIAMELFVMTRDDLYPNPECDEIKCIFYAIENNISTECSNDSEAESKKSLGRQACGYILVNDLQDIVQNEGKIHGIDADIEVKIVKTEVEALEALLELCAHWDPDVYAGYEIEMSSWGYLIDRAKFLCLNIAPLLSRVPSQKIRDFVDEDRDQFTDLDVEMKLCGRILLDVWRLMRSEIALTSYTFENVMYHILHKRCPLHSYRDLSTWFKSPCSRWIVLEYYLERVRGIMELLDQLDLLGRTSEMAKLIGIQFYEVLSRGSQFRVESMMLRIAKPRNLVPLSPSVQQRAHMRAPEYLPLILEPQSRFYADPLIVLDFQSLYPSMIIAYNYCFSTCLGRVEHLGQSTPFEFGASQLRVSPTMLRKLFDEDLVNISPCGVVFVKSTVREGILPRMLTEILDTRLMVKQSMKLHKSNSALKRILHSRQLGLKLMANVTYGYTAANFSGRMPAVEVGDSVVAKGRETLERTIKMVEANEKWGVKVVYGDTDSLFVLVPGRNREQAFKIGEEIAAAATKENPHPVKLKLEKVYQPCILQTKKRYVGYMYETPEQTEPIYEAKGIETVRRDGCPAVAKMLEKVLRILFETADVSQVKQYVCRQFTKLLSGRANLQDLIFAKEFRGLNGYKPTACVPALELTRKWIQTDPRRIPRRGERVPFIITNGPPGVPLIRLVRSPYEVLADGGLKINSIYYITKAIIPPLNRCLLLIGADVNDWFTNLPRKILMTPALSAANEMISGNQQKKSTISQYFSTTNCVIECGRQTKDGICNVCAIDSTKCVVTLHSKIAKIERAFQLTQQICQACCGRVGDLNCGSLDCPVLYVFEIKRRDLQQIEHFRKLLAKF